MPLALANKAPLNPSDKRQKQIGKNEADDKRQKNAAQHPEEPENEDQRKYENYEPPVFPYYQAGWVQSYYNQL